MPDWQTLIRDIPDFPKPGVVFKDITPLLADADGYSAAIDAMAGPWRGVALDAVLGIESRGFILGAALARALGTGRSAESRVGTEGVSTCRSRWSPQHKK